MTTISLEQWAEKTYRRPRTRNPPRSPLSALPLNSSSVSMKNVIVHHPWEAIDHKRVIVAFTPIGLIPYSTLSDLLTICLLLTPTIHQTLSSTIFGRHSFKPFDCFVWFIHFSSWECVIWFCRLVLYVENWTVYVFLLQFRVRWCDWGI